MQIIGTKSIRLPLQNEKNGKKKDIRNSLLYKHLKVIRIKKLDVLHTQIFMNKTVSSFHFNI